MQLIIRCCIIAILFFLSHGIALGQKHPLSAKVMGLVNEARTSPTQFLQKHRAAIAAIDPKFAKLLSVTKPLSPAIWDPALEVQSKARLGGQLDPPYQGKNSLCGNAAGMHGTSGEFEAMQVLADFYTNLLDPNCKYLGMAFDAGNETYWYSWGYQCERVKAQYTFEGKVDSSKVDFNKLNTAQNAAYLSAQEKRMVLEINLVRAYPKVYAQIIGQHLHDQANGPWGLDHDDYVAGMELMEELNASEPLSILQPMECVYQAAKAHGLDCGKRGFMDHTGSDGSHPWERIEKMCPATESGNENLQGSGDPNPRNAVIALLVDGGISNRGHRYNMLNSKWRYVGCYLLSGKMNIGTTHNWVQNFAN